MSGGGSTAAFTPPAAAKPASPLAAPPNAAKRGRPFGEDACVLKTARRVDVMWTIDTSQTDLRSERENSAPRGSANPPSD
jgi:hypothetical protein